MSKNPVFEFLKQQGAFLKPEGPSIPLIGQPRFSRKRPEIEYVQAFSYRGARLESEGAVVDNVLANPHPTDVFADSSQFAPNRLNLVRQLLIATTIKILPDVRLELADIEKGPASALKELLFPGGQLNSRIELSAYRAVQEYEYVATRYTNLLHFRKRLLEGPMQAYRERTSVNAKGKERGKIIREALKSGISWRTVRLANKGDERRRYTDEILSVYGVLSPILTGRDCFILTADRDVFDQFYQFTVLLHDDYGSFLIGEDYRQNPTKYGHVHRWATPLMQTGAVTIGRISEPNSLIPIVKRTCASWVIDVNSLDFMSWIGLREIEAALRFQEDARDGRVADGGDARSVHISLEDHTCKMVPAHFTVGEDRFAISLETKLGRIRLSRFDLARVATDKPVQFQERPKQRQRARRPAS